MEPTTNQPDATEVLISAQELFQEIAKLGKSLMQPWTLYQLIIIAVAVFLSLILTRTFYPVCERWFENKTAVLGRISHVFVNVHRRMALMVYIPIGLSVATLMQLFTWPSRSFIVSLSVELAIVWLMISAVTSVIKNNTLRRFIMWMGWLVATLNVTGLLEPSINLLDSAALEFGETRLSVLMILISAFSLVSLAAVTEIISKTATKRIEKISDLSPSMTVLLGKTLQIALYVSAFFIGLKVIGFDLGNLAVLSGAIGLGIGFGLQKIVSNLTSGFIILLDKSIKPGDVISLNDTFGWITQLGARYASVTTRDGHEHLIPNEDFITNKVINWSHSSDFVRLDIFFGVDYTSNPHEVKKVASQTPIGIDRVVSKPAPVCHIVNFGDSSIDFVLRFWIRDPSKGLTNIRGNVYLALWDALLENNISIPYPRREITMLEPKADIPISLLEKKSDNKT